MITNDSLSLGGAETVILQHLDCLDRNFFEVHFITFKELGELLSEGRKKADYYACLNRRFGLDIASVIKLRRYIICNNIRIIHTNQWLDSLYVLLATQGLPVIKINSIHGYNYTWRHYVNLGVIKHFDLIISVSKSLKLDLCKMGIPYKKICVVYNCYDAMRFSGVDNFREYKRNEPFRLVMTGNFHWWKDQITLIKAVHILISQKGYNIELNLVGKGDDKLFNEAQNVVKKHVIAKHVKFWGSKRVNGDFLSQFDLFVFSSICDTFGVALVEAMASNLPVLVSDIPPSIEIIQYGKCGLCFETGNPRSCAEKIEKYIKDPTLRKLMAQRGYVRSQRFRASDITKELEKVYSNLIK